MTLHTANHGVDKAQHIEHFSAPVHQGERAGIKGRIFGGFTRCLYMAVKFDSYPELLFARILERDPCVQKWVRPPVGSLAIQLADGKTYYPDFVVETDSVKYLCEPKRADLVQSPEVKDKTNASLFWCEHATKHAETYGGKPWKYLLIPHDIIGENMTLQGLELLCCKE